MILTDVLLLITVINITLGNVLLYLKWDAVRTKKIPGKHMRYAMVPNEKRPDIEGFAPQKRYMARTYDERPQSSATDI